MDVRKALLLPLAALVLTACNGSGDPSAGPTALPPITSSPSPTPTAVAVPAEATAATPQGAAEFARYWYTVLTSAFRTLDTSTLRAISAPECEACNNFAGNIESRVGQGTRYDGGAFTVTLADAPAVVDGERVLVDVRYDTEALRLLDAQGQVVRERDAAEGVDVLVQLRRSGSSWQVVEIASAEAR